MTDIWYSPDVLGQDQLGLYEESLKPGRTSEDLLFQVLLDWGLEPSLSRSRSSGSDPEVFVVDDGALIACFAAGLGHQRRRARDRQARATAGGVSDITGFASDADRINAEQVFAEVSPATDVKAI